MNIGLKTTIFGLLLSNICIPNFCIEYKISKIQKTGEIKEIFEPDNEINFFWKITGICCDQEDRIYVADSGWNKIFKFNSTGKCILSFGREGAGPGEFLGSAKGRNLRISAGNDGNIYVLDYGSWRMSVHSQNGVFIKQFKLHPYTSDTPVVNSKGEIYLLSNRGIRVVDHYDSNFNFKESLLDFEAHLQFPYWKPQGLIGSRRTNEREVIKLITKDDNLVIVSNFSLRVFVFDQNNQKKNEFKIEEKTFIDDFKERLNRLKDENSRLHQQPRKYSRGDSFIFTVPFYAFLDGDDNLCLNYLRSDKSRVIYRYKIDGTFMGIWLLPKDASQIKCTDSLNHLFGPREFNTSIGIYSIENSKR